MLANRLSSRYSIIGATRTEAAKIGGVGLQIIRDWVLRFNARGPDALLKGKPPGQPSKLNDLQRWAIAGMHLAEIAAAVAPAAHAVLLVDQAGWHMSTRLVVPANITIIALPPKCPELNPVQKVWQFMRDNWFSNRIFKSYDDLVDHCCEAWNKLIDQPWRIMSTGLRQWAHEF
jgi:transposase